MGVGVDARRPLGRRLGVSHPAAVQTVRAVVSLDGGGGVVGAAVW